MGLLDQELIWKNGSSIEISSMYINDGGAGASTAIGTQKAERAAPPSNLREPL